MTVQALGSYIFTAKYANHMADKRRREGWDESRARVFGMHRTKYAGVEGVEAYIAEAEAAFGEKLVLGSQRVLQFGGEAVLKKEARGFNCTSSYADRPRFFQEAFWLLLCGAGVGFSVQWHHVDRLPALAPVSGPAVAHVVEDTIEGWADALGALVSSYLDDDGTPSPGYRGRVVEFDYSLIRAEGSPLSSGSGRAPGPEPLRRALERIRGLLQNCVERNRLNGQVRFDSRPANDLHAAGKMQPVDVYDIVMHASDAVLSGGVRRSASICIFSPDDSAMAHAKTGNWFQENPQRGRSNNSALLLRDGTTREAFDDLMTSTREFGEPGFYWSDSREMVPNPCNEIGFFPVDEETGETGWAFCNLSLMNMGRVKDMDQARRAARAAAILGTLQAGYTRFEYLGPVSERIARREALLGVSMTGMMEAPDLVFEPQSLRELARVVLDTNSEVAGVIGIRPAARATCVKPEGTSSCLLGTSSGIHPHHSRRYLRRVQANHNEPPAQWFAEHNPDAVEASVWSATGKDLVLTFAIEVPETAVLSRDVGAMRMLELVKLVKENWVDAGKRTELCVRPWLSHNVSNTVVVDDGEWSEAADFIFENRDVFAGVSLLSRSGDLDYPQAPFVEVLTPEEIIERYGKFGDESLLSEAGILFTGLWEACDQACSWPGADGGLSDDGGGPLRLNWIRDFHALARDRGWEPRRLAHFLKHLWLWGKWQAIVENTVDVDYTAMTENEDNTSFEQQAACAGGSCSII